MNFLRRRLIHSLVVLVLGATGFGVTSVHGFGGGFSLWQRITRNQAEFDRVADAIKGKSPAGSAEAQKQRSDARATTEGPGPIEAKVIEIEYDAEGNAIGSDGTVEATEPEFIDLDSADGARPKRKVIRTPGAVPFQDTKRHYSFDVPPGWQEMSSQELAQINKGARSLGFGVKVSYNAGFRRKNTEPGTTPYVLLAAKSGKVKSYEEVEQAIDREMPRAVEKAQGTLSKVASNMAVNGASLDRSTNRIVFRSKLNVNGVGKMQAMSIGHLGSQGVVFVHSYALEKEFSRWVTTFERLNDSFQYEEGYEFGGSGPPGLAQTFQSMFDSSWGMGTLIGGVGGMLAGLVMLAFRKPRRSRSWKDTTRDALLSDPHSVAQIEQNRIENAVEEMHAMQLDHTPASSPVPRLMSASRVLTIVIALSLFGTGAWWYHTHGPETMERLPELKKAAVAWWIEKATGQTPDEIHADSVAQVRAVTDKPGPKLTPD